MSFINKLVIREGNDIITTALIEPTLWQVCETAGTERVKYVSLPNFALARGVQITIRFLNTNTYENNIDRPLALKINQNGLEIPITYKGTIIPSDMLVAGINYQFVYNGDNLNSQPNGSFELISAATQWANPQNVYVNLADDNYTNSVLQGGSTNAEVLSINGILGIAHGGTGTNTQEANRLVWSTSTSVLQASSHYADAAHIGINSTSANSNLEVHGTVHIVPTESYEDEAINKYFKVGNLAVRYLSIGANGLQAYNSDETSGTLLIQPAGGALRFGNTATPITATLHGNLNLVTTDGLNFSGIHSTNNNVFTPLWFSIAGVDNVGDPLNGIGTPQYNINLCYNPSTHFLGIDNGGITSTTGDLSIAAESNVIISGGTNHSVIFQNNDVIAATINADGTIIIGMPESTPSGYQLYVDGPTKINNNLYVTGDIIPSPVANSEVTFGPVSHITFQGTNETIATIGDKYTPIYWHNGAPEPIYVVQKQNFTIPANTSQVVLTHTAYDSNTIVLQIVITENGDQLTYPITTISEQNSLTLQTTTLGNLSVSGYVITARGVELTSQGGGS